MQPEQPFTPPNTNPEPATGPNPPTPQPQVIAPVQNPGPTPPQTAQPSFTPLQPPSPIITLPKSRKKLFMGIGLAAILVLAGAAFVFGYFLPNQPSNVWSTGMSRTGDAIDKLTDKIADPATFESLKTNKVTITGAGEINGDKINFNVNSLYDEASSDNSASFKTELTDPERLIDINVKVKTIRPDGAVWPNIYLNITGLKNTGIEAFLPKILDYDGKWIAVEQDVYDQFIPKDQEKTDTEVEPSKVITHEDIISIMRDVNAVNREYIFTDDSSKAVLVMGDFVGSETSEGIQANRYKATIHKENATAYCKALIDKINTNQAVRKFYSPNDEDTEQQKKECESVGEENDTASPLKEEFDVWIDKKYKLLHKVRVAEDLEKRNAQYQKQKTECQEQSSSFSSGASFCDYYDDRIETGESYTEFGQIYSGTDDITLFLNTKKDTDKKKEDVRGTFKITLEGLLFEGKVTYDMQRGEDTGNLTVDIRSEATDEAIDAAKPDGAIPVMDVYRALFETPAASESLGASTDESAENAVPGIFDLFR